MSLKNLFLAGGTGLMVMLAACQKDDNTNSSTTTSTQDQTFIAQASMSNNAEIQMGNLAKTKATDSLVKVFAQMMVTQHTLAQTNLKDTASKVNISVADSIGAANTAMMTALQALSGRSFDSTYVKDQIMGHQMTVTNFQTEISSGTNAWVKTFASGNLPIIQMHLMMADSLAAHLH